MLSTLTLPELLVLLIGIFVGAVTLYFILPETEGRTLEMETSTDLADSIKACRTCGIHFVTPSEYQLKHLFQSCQEHSGIMLIRLELAQWNIVVSENDGYPQYICNTCIHKFEQIFQLRTACINAQNEFRKFYAVPNGNITNIKIKTEVPDENDETEICDFIYVDELTDGDYDGATPFNIPHIPIKEEVIEAAAVPIDDLKQSLDMVESASRVVIPTDKTQVDSVNVCQTDAMLQMSPHVVECNLCHHISSNQEDHKHHMQAVHDIRDLECHICGKEFKNSTSARLKFHIKWHTLNKPIKCNLCGFICKSKDALNLHKERIIEKSIAKYVEKTRYANQVDANILDVKQDENMMCQEDDKKLLSCSSSDEDYDTTEVATGASNLSTYVDGHLNTFACAKCSETFAAIEQLREHHQQHLAAEQHKPKPKFKCSFVKKCST
ncbi:Zinc finger protein 692 [Eumeta japonica]|uniref:Zinc finger protein 692 n=1 Tax=Eumeta variegata TaxID=151549 RepID=A0A4C1TMD0_EUMVA|nr:Zinc finger protein 692 [Eumeta japonica]